MNTNPRPLTESLESRRLLAGDVVPAADPPPLPGAVLEVSFGAGAANAVTFTDPDGTAARVALRGGGTGTIRFSGVDVRQGPAGRGVAVTGTALRLDAMTLAGTTPASTLSVTGRGGDGLLRGYYFAADGPLRALAATPLVLNGTVLVAGGVGRVTLGGAEDAQLDLRGAAGDPAASVRLGRVINSSIISGRPLREFRADDWRRTPGSAVSHGSLRGPSISRLKIAGESGPDLETGSVGVAHRDAPAGPWNIAGDVGKISFGREVGGISSLTAGGKIGSIVARGDYIGDIEASAVGSISVGPYMFSTIMLTAPFSAAARSLDRLTVKGDAGVTLGAAGNIGTITAGIFNGGGVFAGVDLGRFERREGLDGLLVNDATIERFTAGRFQRTRIAAFQLGRVDLGVILLENRIDRPSPQRFPFGLYAGRIESLQGQDRDGRLLRASGLDDPAQAAAILAATFPDPQEFELTVF